MKIEKMDSGDLFLRFDTYDIESLRAAINVTGLIVHVDVVPKELRDKAYAVNAMLIDILNKM